MSTSSAEVKFEDPEDKIVAENQDGSFHQEQLGTRPKRKWFFVQKDNRLADAVSKDANDAVFTDEEAVWNSVFSSPH
jgi:hypothetical protein